MLYVVATPIGNLEDITLRALETLKKVDLVAAEDTRHTQILLNHYGIRKPMISLHEFNEVQRISQLLEKLNEGKQIALVTDAGTPLISDPGFRLVQALHQHSIKVVPIPGPCAAICALSVCGLPTDRFIFEGFLPVKKTAAQQRLKTLLNEPRTIIFYEAPHRIEKLISLLIEVFGKDRMVCIARELTKAFETIHQGKLLEVQEWLMQDAYHRKGEFVVLIQGSDQLHSSSTAENELIRLLSILLNDLPLKQAVSLATKISGHKRNTVYEMALKQLGSLGLNG